MRRLDGRGVAKQRCQIASVVAPKNCNKWSAPRGEGLDGLLGDLFPALAAVGSRLTRLHRQDPVQQHHTALAPGSQVSGCRLWMAEVCVVLGEDVDEAARQPPHVWRDGEAEPHRMT